MAILAGAAVAAFAVSTAAVSSATTRPSLPAAGVKYPFSSFSFSGGVSTSAPASPATFSLNFTTSFALNANSPGIVNMKTGTLDTVTIKERVSYPIPGTQLVGPAQLPFSSEKLMLLVAIAGKCWIHQASSGQYVFNGSLACVTSTLTLGTASYSVVSLLTSVSGTFTPPNPASGTGWSGSLTATFSNPGYTFPVATLGSYGGTTLQIGDNGATVATQGVTFTGSTAAGT